MRYDFDMFLVNNPSNDHVIVSGGPRINACADNPNHIVAIFRDSRTIEAIMAAPPIIRLFLEEAGFGLKHAPTNAAKRRADPEMRQLLVEQLSEAFANRAMRKALSRAAHETDFDLHAFVAFVAGKEATTPRRMTVANTTQAPSGGKVMPRRPCDLSLKPSRRRARPV